MDPVSIAPWILNMTISLIVFAKKDPGAARVKHKLDSCVIMIEEAFSIVVGGRIFHPRASKPL